MRLFIVVYIIIFTYVILINHYVCDDFYKELTILEYIRIGIFTLISDVIICVIEKLIKAIQQYQYKSVSLKRI